jgi:DNA replicative helicase MCM subunit Mcm2 (Cdc46/Mcm family)
MKQTDCIRELKVHGMVEYILSKNGQKEPILTQKAITLIENAWIVMREKYPEATEEDVTIRALIFVVVEKLGSVCRDSLPDFIQAIREIA